MLRIRVLGYPAIELDGAPVDGFISQKALALLCYLALEPRPHARESLAGLFWGEMPQERALGNLRQALHNVQKLVPGYVTVTRQTAQWAGDLPFSLDVEALDSGVQGGEPIPGGLFMDGVMVADAEALDHWMTTRRAHYQSLALALLANRLDQALAHRQWSAVEGLARQVVALDPYAEGAYRALWRAQLTSGAVGAALASYQTLVERLSVELGVEPAPETRALVRRLELSQNAPRHNLPAPSSVFVGREDELAQAEGWLTDAGKRVVTVLGIGGVGKSRLAQELGRRLAASFVNGVRYIALTSVVDVIYLPSALAEALGVSLRGVADPQREIWAFLAERELLLIFDNAEHLPGFADWLAALLAAAPDITVLVTSRHRLDLREEWVLPLEGLTARADRPVEESAGVQLLTHNARQRGYTAVLEPAPAADLCGLLEGMPLGIELAGAMLLDHPLVELVEAVRRSFDNLQQRWRNAEPRHSSLRAVFETSWQMLPPDQQTALANLSVFGGSFTAEAADAVAGAAPSLLDVFTARSLVRRAGERYSLHAIIRRYAQEACDDEAGAQTRYRDHYLGHIARAEAALHARDLSVGIQLLKAEIDNIRQLWQACIEQRDLPLIDELTTTLHRFYEGIGWFAEGEAFFAASLSALALDAAEPAERVLLGRLLSHRAGIGLRLGRMADVSRWAHEAARLLEGEDGAALAFALNTLGIAQLYTGDTPTARVTLERCADLYRRLGMFELIKPLINLASVYSRNGETERARLALEEAYPLAVKLNDKVGIYHIANGLGVAYSLLGDQTRALTSFEEALTMSEGVGFMQGKAVTLNNLGDVYTLVGKPQRGLKYATEAVSVAREIKDARSLSYALTTLTLTQVALGYPAARQTLIECLEAALQSNTDPMTLMALYAAGVWYAHDKRGDVARQLWTLVAAHPATETDYRQRAVERLDGAPDNVPDTPPQEQAAAVLADLRAERPNRA
ncbi:MAG: tetratricopeptide repeat protein [Anaerolineae bacterium]|jgi:DNA-binding SARP family transcriptional activator/tetratricopeptide (TPR) repeat protein|nr:tetratricopeptide repeat protein [Anaerolineae bacterium]